MKHLFKLTCAGLLAAALCGAFSACTPKPHKTAIVAHMGFWDCEAAGQARNSVASLTAAQDNGFWGSECDANITADDVVIIGHGPKINGVPVREVAYADTVHLLTLPNGEFIPTLDAYLDQAAKAKTVLVLELKAQLNEERENLLTDKAVESLKAHGIFSPKNVAFISFSQNICKKIANEYPAFTNQYLGGDIAPADLKKDGINGIDYNYKVFVEHPEWITEAHDLGMSVNVWTIDKEEQIQDMIEKGVDQITTNAPLLTRSLLGDKEQK